ncbi:MAG: endo-1,3-alpha-glucanase family glycosylhydrolase [Limisphaerales bacterium]
MKITQHERFLAKVGLFAALLFLQVAAPCARASGSTNHFVFAHYMVCYADYGDVLQGFMNDIQDAQAAGIDGFALNCGEWNGPDWYYQARVKMMYQAAEQLGTGFKLFFSVDESNTNDIVAMLSSQADEPNSFYYQGKMVVSTSGQNSVDWPGSVFQPLADEGIDVFFVPYFLVQAGVPVSYNSVSNLLAQDSYLDGLYYFAAGLVSVITNRNMSYGQACKGAGKLFMGGYSPSYWGCAQPTAGRQYFETQGGEGTIAEWMWIITNQPDWVEISTWNDFNESTYSLAVTNPVQYESELLTPCRYSHDGYLELSKHYISWYKTAQEPPITNDALFYFYRTHSTNLVALNTNEIPVTAFNGDVQDVIYNTLFLTAPAQLTIASGTNLFTNALAAGLQQLRTPFSPGPQIFTLTRNGTTVLTVQGPPVLSQIQVYDYFPASGYAYGAIPPPGLHVVRTNQ